LFGLNLNKPKLVTLTTQMLAYLPGT
jgi:hypothetical protein